MPLRAKTMTTDPTTVFITGANRGIGKGLVELYLGKRDHIVIAAVRTLKTAEPLAQIPVAKGSRLVVVKLDATVESDAADAIKELSSQHAIKHMDIVLANAGVCYIWPTVANVKIDDMLASLRPNVFGLIWLYQATRHLLNNAADPKWVTIGSTAGSIGASTDFTLSYLMFVPYKKRKLIKLSTV
jgi:NAD(P)-dependent dehydrogenase (short-subunit alcohol dehydrogenase family)